ncbi:hypothetical protein CL618_00230 [archaeon]|nr:hypothetical protein [archaeon]
MVNWKNKVDPGLKKFLETLLVESRKQKKAFLEADDPKIAQVWCSMAELGKQIVELNRKLDYLEKALVEVSKKKVTKKVTKRKTSKRKK